MPTYEYACENCGHQFEEFQSIKASPLKKCPSCGKLKLNRLIGTGAGIIFKGSGFYATDYRSDSYTNAAKSENGQTPKAETTKAEAKTETKTAETKESKSKTDSKPEKKKSA